MLEKRKVWVAISNTDLTEGRGQPVIVAYATTEAHARRLGAGKGVFGSDCPVEEQTFWVAPDNQVFQYVGELKTPKPEETRRYKKAAALQKARELGLSDEEIRLIQESPHKKDKTR